MASKEEIYLTYLTMHVRDFTATPSFSRVAAKGVFYTKTSSETLHKKKGGNKAAKGTYEMVIKFPPDLQERIDRGEVELMIPDGGLPIYAGKDMWEMAAKMKRVEDNKKKPRTRVLRS